MKSNQNQTAAPWASTVISAISSVLALQCPICIPAVASFLASIGVAATTAGIIVQPLLVVLLLASVASLAWSARLHGCWWIVVAGFVGAALIYAGHQIWFSPPLIWTGAIGLITVSIYNLRLKRSCCRCDQQTAK